MAQSIFDELRQRFNIPAQLGAARHILGQNLQFARQQPKQFAKGITLGIPGGAQIRRQASRLGPNMQRQVTQPFQPSIKLRQFLPQQIQKNVLSPGALRKRLFLNPKEFKVASPEQQREMLAKLPNFVGSSGINPTRTIGKEVIPVAKSAGAKIFKIAKAKEIPGLRVAKVATQKSKEALQDALRQQFTDVFAKTRGIITNPETVKKAESLGVSKPAILNLPSGSVVNAEQFTAIRQLIAAEGENVVKLKSLAATGEEAAMRAYTQAAVEHSKLLAVQKGLANEGGKMVQSNRIVVDAVSNAQKQLNKLLEQAPPDQTEAISKKIAQLDLNNVKDVQETINQLTKTSFLQKLVEWSVAVKLYNPTTWVVNALSNTVRSLAEAPFKAGAGVVDRFLGPFYGGGRTRFVGEAGADIFGKTQGVRAGVTNAVKALTDETASTFGRVGKFQEVSPRGVAIKGAKGKVIRTSFRILGAADEFFKTIQNSAELHTLAFRQASKEGLKDLAKSQRIAELLSSPTPKMIGQAEKQTLKTVFQEPLGAFGQSIERFRNEHPIIKFIIPFFRTPVNLIKQGIEFSPLGVQPLIKGLRAGRGQAADAIARYSIGSMVTLGLTMHALDGNISGAGPKDRAERDALYRTGWQPHSIKIGDHWVSYSRIDPFAQLFQLAAAIAEGFKEGDTNEAPSDKIQAAASQVARGILDKSYVRGLNDTLNALFDPTRYGQNWLEQFAAGQIPNISGTVARATDPVVREVEGIPQAIQAQIPGLSQQLLPRRNALGQEITRPGTTLERLISPFKRSPEKPSLVNDELTKLGVKVSFTGTKIKGVSLGPKTKNEYQRVAGKLTEFNLNKLFKSPVYKNASQESKKKMVESLIRNVRARARQYILYQARKGG